MTFCPGTQSKSHHDPSAPRGSHPPFSKSIHTESQFFSGIDLFKWLFSIAIDKKSCYLFAFTWEEWKYTWTEMAHCFTEEASYFPPFTFSVAAALDDVRFSAGPSLFQYAHDLFPCLPSQSSSQEDSIHLLTFLTLKGQIALCPNSSSVLTVLDLGNEDFL